MCGDNAVSKEITNYPPRQASLEKSIPFLAAASLLENLLKSDIYYF